MKLIETLKYVLLGVIQGFTEPLPISSSGHLVIFKNLFNMNALADLNFEIIVNFGSFLAIFLIYRKIIFKLIKGFFLYLKTKEEKFKPSFKYCLLIVIGSIPAGIIGFIFKDKIELISNNVTYIGVALLITALALFIVRKIDGKKTSKEITYKDSFLIGLFQAVALLPGISRSGSTIVGGLSRDIKKEDAVTFSFMLYLPISLATMVLGASDFLNTPNITTYILPYVLGMIASFITTYFATKWFLDIVKKKKLIYFVIYCLIVGLAVILFL